MMIKTASKRGIAMVELIFALVIMAIVLLSAPMLIQQSIKSSNIALQQESIAAVASHTGILLSKHWDEANTNHTAGVSPILQIPNPIGTDFNLSGINFDNNVSGRTSQVANMTYDASLSLSSDSNDTYPDDIDDYNGLPVTLSVFNSETSSASTIGDYIDQSITIDTVVTYADDRPTGSFNSSTVNAGNAIFTTPNLAVSFPGRQSNIKFLNVRLSTSSTASELDKNISLNAFSFNLGTFSIGAIQY